MRHNLEKKFSRSYLIGTVGTERTERRWFVHILVMPLFGVLGDPDSPFDSFPSHTLSSFLPVNLLNDACVSDKIALILCLL